ncbi:DUF5994 family protein [Mycobacterium sp. 141]|uniref:DUF5994 family protein n=1 Tax=Mycobacterium sp. 141 TaxID=1120797 RepID=UPI00037C4CC5|nr:DUF5994 family protein [Mycobacterium sp. 141]
MDKTHQMPALPDEGVDAVRYSRGCDRLRLSGRREIAEHIDGAWWPASKRLEDELPDLVAAIERYLPSVVLVAYSRDGWIAPPARISLGDHHQPVEVVGFESDEPGAVILIGQDGHHLTLRVVDPDTEPQEAGLILDQIPRRAPSQRTNAPMARSLADVAKKLADHEGLNSPQRNAQILRWCGEAAERFDDARIQTFVPILVEHIVNNRIHREHHAVRGRG